MCTPAHSMKSQDGIEILTCRCHDPFIFCFCSFRLIVKRPHIVKRRRGTASEVGGGRAGGDKLSKHNDTLHVYAEHKQAPVIRITSFTFVEDARKFRETRCICAGWGGACSEEARHSHLNAYVRLRLGRCTGLIQTARRHPWNVLRHYCCL